MAVGIAHAVMSENKDKYGEVGDQLQTSSTNDRKGEIRLADWYNRSGGWDEYLECTDRELAANASAWAVKIANSKNYGYSQGGGVKDGRWSGYKSIKSVGFDQGKGNFDCSSLVISCYVFAGCPNLKPTGYTGNMARLLMATGKFKKYTDAAHIRSAASAKIGGVYVAKGAHTAIVVSGVPAPAAAPETEEKKKPYVLVSGSVWVRQKPGMDGEKLFVARKGDRLDYLGATETDNDGNKWYKVDTAKGIGYISAFAKKKTKYTELITNV